MKHFITILSFILAITLVGCENGNVTKLKKEIAAASAGCPYNIGATGDVISIRYNEKENMVSCYVAINEKYVNIKQLAKNKEAVHNNMRVMIADESTRELVKMACNAKAGIRYIYKSPTTGKSVVISMPYEELNEVKNNPITPLELNQMAVKQMVEIENSNCPSPFEDGLVLAKCNVIDDNVVYYIQFDDANVNMTYLKQHKDVFISEAKSGMKEAYRTDPTLRSQLKYLVKGGYNLIYRYFAKSNKDYIDVVFDNSELARL